MAEAPTQADARQAAELAARASYGRLVAILASRTRDIAAAEDALADALAAALATWPARGVPDRPEAWLLTAARRNLMHRARHRRVQNLAVDELVRRSDQPTHAPDWITGVLHHDALCTLYALLLARAPSIGVAVARAGALLGAGRTDDAQVALNALTEEDVRSYQPYWVVRARVAERLGEPDSMRAAVARALGLTDDPAVRRFLADWLGR